MPQLKIPGDETRKSIQEILGLILRLYTPVDGYVEVAPDALVLREVYLFALERPMKDLFPKLSEFQRLRYLKNAVGEIVFRPKDEQTVDNLLAILNVLLEGDGEQKLKITAFLNVVYSDAPLEIHVVNLRFQKATTDASQRFWNHSRIKAKYTVKKII